MAAQHRDSIRWSDETYSLGEFVGEFQAKLPCIVKVTTGYNGPSPAESLSSGQVIHVQSAGRQTRVLGKDAGGRRFCIPLLFNVPCTVSVQPSGLLGRKKKYSLAAILERNSLPVKIDLADNDKGLTLMSQEHELLRLGTIQIDSAYEERSLIGNMITAGIMSPSPVAIPTHVAAAVSVAEGRVDGDNETWLKLKADYRRAATLVDFASVFRADDVRWYSARQLEDVIRCAQTFPADSEYLSLANARSPDQCVYTSLDNRAAATNESSYYNLERTSGAEPHRTSYQNVNPDSGSEYVTCVM